jgi:ribosome-binding protein aMBF1 (putative translation factor)
MIECPVCGHSVEPVASLWDGVEIYSCPNCKESIDVKPKFLRRPKRDKMMKSPEVAKSPRRGPRSARRPL